MPPSPALRFSPGREPKGDNHKRGRSLEGGILFKEKDDDLALFNEMQSREKEDFLLQSTDDFEDSFSTKLRYFSDLKFGISIAGRGESSGMLNAEGEKNDYDWLITPPDTPLFASLDDEPPPASVPSRGRPRSQPISISRSSTMEKSYKSSRGSASPNRSSPSPRSGSSTLQSRGRPSSVRNSSPTPSQRPATPSRRPSTPPSKASPPAPRASTPTPRRASTGSIQRGVSPIRTTSGNNSVSPKVKAWQSTIPGFSSEAPPNLRTSLGDRPASYVRGSSPASRNGRQSMSPIASRSVSSSHSQDRDRISSYSKGSVASSGDDDVDSLQSVHVGSLDRMASRRVGGFTNNRTSALPKKSARGFSPSSAPKRSFDSAIRDNRKSPQNMFRPLMSSVPSTTFYAGKGSSVQRSLLTSSSVTTSSNASSDQGVSFAHDNDGIDHHHNNVAIDSGKELYNDVRDDIFAFDRADDLNEDVAHQSQFQDLDRDSLVKSEHEDSEEFSHQDAMCGRNDFSEVESSLSLDVKICSRCGCKYRDVEALNADINLCADCSKEDSVVSVTALENVMSENSVQLSASKAEESKLIDESKLVINVMPEAPDKQVDTLILEESKQGFTEPVLVRSISDIVIGSQQQLPNHNEAHTLKVDLSDGAGISVVLKKSSSIKGPVFQGRSFTASTVSYDDVSFTRDSANSFRSSIGHGSTSGSSSLDLCSVRQMETRIQRQLSGKKSDLDGTRSLSRGSSFSGSQGHQVASMATSTLEVDALTGPVIPEEYVCERTDSSRTMEDSSAAVAMQVEEEHSELPPSSNEEAFRDNGISLLDTDASPPSESENIVTDANVNQNPAPEVLSSHSRLASISEIEAEDHRPSHQSSENNDLSPNLGSMPDEGEDPSISVPSDKDATAPTLENNTSDRERGVSDESTVMVECNGGSKARSLTLEEATDTILFCSSIVHDLAYRAATIAIEKELSVPLDDSRPTVTILGKSTPDRKDSRARNKRGSKSSKVKRQVEAATKGSDAKMENDENANDDLLVQNVGLPPLDHSNNNKMDSSKPPKLESKCNCTIM